MSKFIYRVLNYEQTLSQFFSLEGRFDLMAATRTDANNIVELYRNINPHINNGSTVDTEFISFSTQLYPIIKKFGSYQDYNQDIRNMVIIVDNHDKSTVEFNIEEKDNFLERKPSSIKKFVVNFNEKSIIDFINRIGLLRCKNGNDIKLSRGFKYANCFNEVICYKKINKDDIVRNLKGLDIDVFFLLKSSLMECDENKLLEYIRFLNVDSVYSFTDDEKKFFDKHYRKNYNFYNIVEAEYLKDGSNYLELLNMFREIKRSVLWKIVSKNLNIRYNLEEILTVEDIAIKESKDLKQIIKDRTNLEKKMKRN